MTIKQTLFSAIAISAFALSSAYAQDASTPLDLNAPLDNGDIVTNTTPDDTPITDLITGDSPDDVSLIEDMLDTDDPFDSPLGDDGLTFDDPTNGDTITDADPTPDMDDPIIDDLVDLTDLRPGAASLLGLDAPGLNKPFPGKGVGLANIPNRGVPPGLAAKGFGGTDGGLVDSAAAAVDASTLMGVANGRGNAFGRNR